MNIAESRRRLPVDLVRLLAAPTPSVADSFGAEIRSQAMFALVEATVADEIPWHARERSELIERVRASFPQPT